MEESQFDIGCQTERPNLPHGRSNIIVFVTSAVPLRVVARGHDSVHEDCKAISSDTHGKKRQRKTQEFIAFAHLSLLTASTSMWASVADSQRLRVSLPLNGGLQQLAD